ncbi:hypothetical protein SORBI_3004G115950 [Sorghum bicolor]|uniref:Uncharacterized protein n=1 Tax=Sorghum bicolor TaxID=4558 RepID=A0A1Z5RLY8_SORBI|nr:hypothetical protein SORBI_3004G115950 [Sorghum bicolor]
MTMRPLPRHPGEDPPPPPPSSYFHASGPQRMTMMRLTTRHPGEDHPPPPAPPGPGPGASRSFLGCLQLEDDIHLLPDPEEADDGHWNHQFHMTIRCLRSLNLLPDDDRKEPAAPPLPSSSEREQAFSVVDSVRRRCGGGDDADAVIALLCLCRGACGFLNSSSSSRTLHRASLSSSMASSQTATRAMVNLICSWISTVS